MCVFSCLSTLMIIVIAIFLPNIANSLEPIQQETSALVTIASRTPATLYVNGRSFLRAWKQGKPYHKSLLLRPGFVIAIIARGAEARRDVGVLVVIEFSDGTSILSGGPGWRATKAYAPSAQAWYSQASQESCGWDRPKIVSRSAHDDPSTLSPSRAQFMWANTASDHDRVFFRYTVSGEVCTEWSNTCKVDFAFQGNDHTEVFLRGVQIIDRNHWALTSTKEGAVVRENDIVAIRVENEVAEGFVKGFIKSESGRVAYTGQHLRCRTLFSNDVVPAEISSGQWTANDFDDAHWIFIPEVRGTVFFDRLRFSPGDILSLHQKGQQLFCRLKLPRDICEPVLEAKSEDSRCNDAKGVVCKPGFRCSNGNPAQFHSNGLCIPEDTIVPLGSVCADPKSVCAPGTHCITQPLGLDPLVSMPTCKKYVEPGFEFGPLTYNQQSKSWKNRLLYACPPGHMQVGSTFKCAPACRLSLSLYGGGELSVTIKRDGLESITNIPNAKQLEVLKATSLTVRGGDEIHVEVYQGAVIYIPFTGLVHLSSGKVYGTNSREWKSTTTGYETNVKEWTVIPPSHPFPMTPAKSISDLSDNTQSYSDWSSFKFKLPADACASTTQRKLGEPCDRQNPCDQGLVCSSRRRLCQKSSPVLRENQNCADKSLQCGEGLWCQRIAGMQPLCVPLLKEGDVCEIDGHSQCRHELYCDSRTRMCTARGYNKKATPSRCLYTETPNLLKMMSLVRQAVGGTGDGSTGAAELSALSQDMNFVTPVHCTSPREFLTMAFDRSFLLYRLGVPLKKSFHLFQYARAVVYNLQLCAPEVNNDNVACVPKSTIYLMGIASGKLEAHIAEQRGQHTGKLPALTETQKKKYGELCNRAATHSIRKLLPRDLIPREQDGLWKQVARVSGRAPTDATRPSNEPQPANGTTTSHPLSIEPMLATNASAPRNTAVSARERAPRQPARRATARHATRQAGVCGAGYRAYTGDATISSSGQVCCSELCFAFERLTSVLVDVSFLSGCCGACHEGGCAGADAGAAAIMRLSEVYVPSTWKARGSYAIAVAI